MSSDTVSPSTPVAQHGEESPAVILLSGRKFLFACALIAHPRPDCGAADSFACGFARRGGIRDDPRIVFLRFVQVSNPQERPYLRHVDDHCRDFLRPGGSAWHSDIARNGWWAWTRQNLLSFHGLDELIHADTMLFILGLTFFVSVIAQTRLLEGLTFYLLRRFRGAVLPTVISVTAVVAFASGILDGVSMIGLTIRTLVIIMLLAAAPISAVRYAVMVCTTVTTVCGIWLAYGEPPNLIMKANLYPHIDNAFFLRYCAPGGRRLLSGDCLEFTQETARRAHRTGQDGCHRCQRRGCALSSSHAPRQSFNFARTCRRSRERARRQSGCRARAVA